MLIHRLQAQMRHESKLCFSLAHRSFYKEEARAFGFNQELVARNLQWTRKDLRLGRVLAEESDSYPEDMPEAERRPASEFLRVHPRRSVWPPQNDSQEYRLSHLMETRPDWRQSNQRCWLDQRATRQEQGATHQQSAILREPALPNKHQTASCE